MCPRPPSPTLAWRSTASSSLPYTSLPPPPTTTIGLIPIHSFHTFTEILSVPLPIPISLFPTSPSSSFYLHLLSRISPPSSPPTTSLLFSTFLPRVSPQLSSPPPSSPPAPPSSAQVLNTPYCSAMSNKDIFGAILA